MLTKSHVFNHCDRVKNLKIKGCGVEGVLSLECVIASDNVTMAVEGGKAATHFVLHVRNGFIEISLDPVQQDPQKHGKSVPHSPGVGEQHVRLNHVLEDKDVVRARTSD